MRKWLYSLICIGYIFRFFYPIFSNPLDHLYSDPARHHDNVTIENFGKSLGSILDPPLPQLFFLLLKNIFGGSIIGTSVVFGLLCAITPWFWYLWAKEVLQTKNKALLFAVLIVFLPSWIGIYAYYMDEIFLLPLLGASLWLSWRAKRKMTYASFILASVLWALTIAVKLNAFFELLIIFPWLAILFCQGKGYNWRTISVILINVAIIAIGYLNYPIWVYHGMGSTWLFPPGQAALNRACFLSGARRASLSFSSHGHVEKSTGIFTSNAVCTEPLPFCKWCTWRQGDYDQKIDLDRKFYIFAPAPNPSLEKRLLYMTESAIYFFFSRSWTDDREDDFIQIWQINMRLIWFPLTIIILFLAFKRKAMSKILVVLFWGITLFYVFFNSSTILEGRYRKPWEGIALATFIYLCPISKFKSLCNKTNLNKSQT